ncbi:hypothetical protein GCM10027073_62730 [Streptomyces chlorus]
MEPAAAVRDGDLQALALAARGLAGGEGVQAGVGDLGDHGDVLVHGEVGEVGELASLLVPAGIVVEEVADRVQAEVLGHHLRGGRAEHRLQRLLQWFWRRFLQCGHGIYCTPQH